MSAPLRVLTWMPPEMTERINEVEGVELIHIPARGPFPEDANGDVLLVGARSVPVMEEALASGVRWIHIYGTGVDGFPIELLKGDQILSCSRGASGVPIAEWVMATLLAFREATGGDGDPRALGPSPRPWARHAVRGRRSGWWASAASAQPSRCARCPSGCACSRCAVTLGRARCGASKSRASSASCSRKPTISCSPLQRPRPPIT